MHPQIRPFTLAVTVALSCLFSAGSLPAEDIAPVRTALTDLESWLGTGANSQRWSTYLNLTGLKTELAKDGNADQAVISVVLKQLESGAPGLELAHFERLRDALRQWSEDLVVAKAPSLPEAALQAESNFRPVTQSDLDKAKSRVQGAVDKLERYLSAGGANGKGWKEYLRWQDLQTQLKAEKPDVDVLKTVEEKFSADQNGLELPVFSHVDAGLEQWITDLKSRAEDLRAQYAAKLKELAEELQKYSQGPSEEGATAVGTRLGWLEDMRQAPALIRAVRDRYSHPNLHVSISGRIVAAGIEQPVNDVAPVQDVILGTDISGTGHTVGRIAVRLVPDNNQAVLETMLVGTTKTRTVGQNGPATIYTNGTTEILGRKRLIIDANGITGLPATATASTKSQITGVAAGRGGIVQRIATDRVYESKSEAEQIGSRHAADRVRRRVDAQAAEQLKKAQSDFTQKFRNPLVRRREFPLLKFNTSKDALFVTARQANRNQLGAPSEAPNLEGSHDMAVRVHESLVNNLASAMLSGVTLKEAELQAKVIELRGSLPDQLKSDEDRDPWSITFAASQPVTVKFGDNSFQVTIRGQRYTSGDREFRAMNVTADYKFEIDGNSSKLVRQGELQISPPGFVSGKGRLSTQQVTLRTLLQRKFGKLFEPEIVSKGLTLPGKWEQAGRLDLKHLQASGGWIAMAWSQSGVPATATAQAALDRK